jgi:hypothetical protein
METDLSPIEDEVPFSLEHGFSLPEIVSQDTDLELGERVALLYGEADLGRRCIISGGEVLEI